MFKKVTEGSAAFARAKLVEEMGELLQLIGKLAAFPDGIHPDSRVRLEDRIEMELADVYAALRYFREQHEVGYCGESKTRIWDMIMSKLAKFRVWGREAEVRRTLRPCLTIKEPMPPAPSEREQTVTEGAASGPTISRTTT